ncbi:hypothetical protein OH76DRAFT_624257 [Lentinus brumalis]|uniref:Uncharacterized protein n=1 Tax=Lentinus brumalis TaxID=2498619 RepID=A0A371D949_9APHY|nr:hypothetical protein OH76DRAFT_624257 [Polyporus brumalis]
MPRRASRRVPAPHTLAPPARRASSARLSPDTELSTTAAPACARSSPVVTPFEQQPVQGPARKPETSCARARSQWSAPLAACPDGLTTPSAVGTSCRQPRETVAAGVSTELTSSTTGYQTGSRLACLKAAAPGRHGGYQSSVWNGCSHRNTHSRSRVLVPALQSSGRVREQARRNASFASDGRCRMSESWGTVAGGTWTDRTSLAYALVRDADTNVPSRPGGSRLPPSYRDRRAAIGNLANRVQYLRRDALSDPDRSTPA